MHARQNTWLHEGNLIGSQTASVHTAHSGGSSSSSSCCKRCTTFCSVVSSSKSQSEQRSSSSLAAAASMTRWVPATDWRSAPTAHPHSRHDRIPTLYSTCTQTRPARRRTPLDDVIARAARQRDPPASQRATPDARAFGLDDYRAFFSGPLVCSYHSPPTDERCFCLRPRTTRANLARNSYPLARSFIRQDHVWRAHPLCLHRQELHRQVSRPSHVAPHTTTAPAVCFFSGRPSHIPSNLYRTSIECCVHAPLIRTNTSASQGPSVHLARAREGIDRERERARGPLTCPRGRHSRRASSRPRRVASSKSRSPPASRSRSPSGRGPRRCA